MIGAFDYAIMVFNGDIRLSDVPNPLHAKVNEIVDKMIDEETKNRENRREHHHLGGLHSLLKTPVNRVDKHEHEHYIKGLRPELIEAIKKGKQD